jgi:hypothetical protein
MEAYGSSRIAAGKVQQILHWPGSFETFRKVPTCLLYDEQGQVLAWGLEAKNASPMPGTIRCEWYVFWSHTLIIRMQYFFRFKLFLEPQALRDESTIDPRLPHLPVRIPLPTNDKPYDLLYMLVWQEGCRFNRRLLIMSMGVCQGSNHAGNWSGGRSE